MNEESAKRLGRFDEELTNLQAQGDVENILRWTGEELAAASNRLAKAKSEDRVMLCAELLVIAYAHVEALSAMEMHDQALSTQNLAMLTVLRMKVNPEGFAQLWLQSLQALCLKASQYIYSTHGDSAIIASQLIAQTYGLFIATAHDYMPRFGATGEMRRFYDHMRSMARKAGEDVSHFQGHRIVPVLAIDILTDNAARLTDTFR